ncbi:multidrug effflux MFS transporter [Shewanella waksmanii]|uniref:multidrug effflux MFS transporter n=1 Tax=Shewanella waksmanii TaxID=213783 RepID=UPI00373612C1
MKTKPNLWLMVIMLMVPQIVETIYSPALASIALSFGVTNGQAAQTLSVYFFAFAMGVIVWGMLADRLGRRLTMLIGLLTYAAASLFAMLTDSFTGVMVARAVSAFGIAVGSVVTQTMLRDAFSGSELAKVFSLMGMGIALSPVLGMFLGGQLAQAGGHQWVFCTLFIMAFVLFVYNCLKLPETQTEKRSMPLNGLIWRMLNDWLLWRIGLLVGLFNIALFSYYQLGAMSFSQLGLGAEQFGYSGALLGVATLLGSYVNKLMIKKLVSLTILLRFAVLLLTLGAAGVYLLQNSIWFIGPMVFVVMAFAIAIPNLLSIALVEYQQHAGSAGAIFGLMYYLTIAAGLALAGVAQNLALVLIACSVATVLVIGRHNLSD